MIYNGTNVTITLHANHNLSNPTVCEINYRKPSGATGTWGATMIGNDQVTYTTTVNDIDEPGVWNLQAKVVKSGVTYQSSLAQMVVEKTI